MRGLKHGHVADEEGRLGATAALQIHEDLRCGGCAVEGSMGGAYAVGAG